MKNKRKAGIIIGVLLLAVLLTVLFRATVSYSGMLSGRVSEDGLRDFLTERGWSVSRQAAEIRDVTIPAKFTEVYEQYNQLQKEQGYDLSHYRTNTVSQYTFIILNLTDGDGNALSGAEAHILVYGNRIIGGDVCSSDLGGYMRGL